MFAVNTSKSDQTEGKFLSLSLRNQKLQQVDAMMQQPFINDLINNVAIMECVPVLTDTHPSLKCNFFINGQENPKVVDRIGFINIHAKPYDVTTYSHPKGAFVTRYDFSRSGIGCNIIGNQGADRSVICDAKQDVIPVSKDIRTFNPMDF